MNFNFDNNNNCMKASPLLTITMNCQPLLLLLSALFLLTACSGDSSSGSATGANTDKQRNYCVKIKDDDVLAKIHNTCNQDIYIRVLKSHFDEVKIKANSIKNNIPVPFEDYDFGACIVPYKPQRIKGSNFICSRRQDCLKQSWSFLAARVEI